MLQNKTILYLSLPPPNPRPPIQHLPHPPAVQRGHVTLGPSPSGSPTDPSHGGLRGPSCRLSVKHLQRNVWPGRARLLPPLISARQQLLLHTAALCLASPARRSVLRHQKKKKKKKKAAKKKEGEEEEDCSLEVGEGGGTGGWRGV